MEATMSGVLLLVFGLLLTGKLCGCTAYGGGGFSVEFIHRDSAKSPYHDPALTAQARMLAAARRSTARAVALASSPGADDAVSKVIKGNGSFEYLMAVNLGTPPRQTLAIVDTGSDLVWIRCGNDSGGDHAAAGPAPHPVLFDPSGSKTFGRVGCQSAACQALSAASCDGNSNCQYLYSYGDGSRTSGLLSTETFTFDEGGTGAGDSRQLRVANVNFGCSTVAVGSFTSDVGGLVGLGAGAVSLVTQLGAATSLGRKFSYCLVPYNVNASSLLNFGARAKVSEPGAVTTPLVESAVNSYYTLALESVKVSERTVATHSSRIIVDSGTTLTFLDSTLLGPLVEELTRRITLPRAESPDQALKLCYNVRGGQVSIPDVTLGLGGGAALTLRAESTFVLAQEGTLCLAVVAASEVQPLSILGNIAQQNFHVGYDLDARTVTFAATDCARPSTS